MANNPIRTIVAALRRALTRPGAIPLKVVACRPLHGGAAIYVADIDDRRIVFAAAPHAMCLLATYRKGVASVRKEVASPRV